ncbi:MAG TPA: FAD binding domain-containing protein [Elusimicrobiales bacterium]|nr:FAD binding domain-containing protein [Elusimicrobiales bacterium]HOL62253.1 FAD binding domain-containing protein [Elusimicrobiales bacterium]HPO96029.1 FAD binding domain-containing protein [Elusimicrobiales bacterium]
MIIKAEKFYSLSDLWKNIKKLPQKRKYICGGTDIAVSLKYGSLDIDCLIDISDVKELSLIKKEKNNIFIGAGVKISEFENSEIIKKYVPSLYESLKYYASPTIRNIATLGGNLANASPCADGVLALLASRAKVILNLYGKKRVLEIKDVFVGPKKTSIKKDELIEGFLVPIWSHKSVFLKSIPRKIFGISKAGLCVCADIKNRAVMDISVAASSVGPVVLRCSKTETFLKGKEINDKTVEDSYKIIKTEVSPINDHRSVAEYRKEIIGVFLKRALLTLK